MNTPRALAPQRHRFMIALAFGALFSASVAWGVYRGTHAISEALEPASLEAGVSCQLRELAGRKPVECAVLVALPADEVWRQITSYEPGVMFDSWWGRYELTRVARQPDGSSRLLGRLSMWLGALPVEVVMQERESEQGRTAFWTSAGSAFTVNRGSWSVSARGERKTLVRYLLDVELPAVPAFITRDLLLDHLGAVVGSIAGPAS